MLLLAPVGAVTGKSVLGGDAPLKRAPKVRSWQSAPERSLELGMFRERQPGCSQAAPKRALRNLVRVPGVLVRRLGSAGWCVDDALARPVAVEARERIRDVAAGHFGAVHRKDGIQAGRAIGGPVVRVARVE
jgi:hypothetical protein